MLIFFVLSNYTMLICLGYNFYAVLRIAWMLMSFSLPNYMTTTVLANLQPCYFVFLLVLLKYINAIG